MDDNEIIWDNINRDVCGTHIEGCFCGYHDNKLREPTHDERLEMQNRWEKAVLAGQTLIENPYETAYDRWLEREGDRIMAQEEVQAEMRYDERFDRGMFESPDEF